MTPPRLVLDTNVLVSALLFHGSAVAWLRHAWQAGAVRPLAGRDTTTELIRVLAYPRFGLDADAREDLLAEFLPWCETMAVPDGLSLPPCRDPFDRPFLALALAARADALVTGDKDLPAVANSFPVPILTPARLRADLETAAVWIK